MKCRRRRRARRLHCCAAPGPGCRRQRDTELRDDRRRHADPDSGQRERRAEQRPPHLHRRRTHPEPVVPIPLGAQYAVSITPSPLDDINPEDIDRIEIIKGAAATTLFGTEAAAGVIQIFTKKGRSGAPQWTAQLETGINTKNNHGTTQNAERHTHQLLPEPANYSVTFATLVVIRSPIRCGSLRIYKTNGRPGKGSVTPDGRLGGLTPHNCP